MKKIVAFLSILVMSVFAGMTFGMILEINPFIPAGISFVASFIPLPQGSMYSLLFTAPGGIATPFTFNFKNLPENLTWNNVVPLTSLRIETQEDGVIQDYVAASIAACNGYGVLGAQAANIVLIRLADGFLKNKNVTISGVTSAAGAIGFYGCSDNIGTVIFKLTTSQIQALKPCTFKKFTAMWVPTMAAVTDTALVTYADGHKQLYNINDLAACKPLSGGASNNAE